MCTIMNFSVFYKLLTYLLTYMGDESIISAIVVPPCSSEPVPLRIFWSGYGPAAAAEAITIAILKYASFRS